MLRIPLLPCAATEATLEFFTELGFDTSDVQQRPYHSEAVSLTAFSRDDVQVHFKGAAPTVNPGDELSGGCLVVVDDVRGYRIAD
ncbi:MAG: hypothetical protein ACSLE6_17180 [Mycobacterium sp.]